MSDEESMMPSLYEFFSIECNFDIIKEFINSRKSRTNKLSFGLLDWFNVNYAKEYGVEYTLTRMGRERTVYVWQAYNAALDGYGKERFDPFARGKSRGGAITLANDKGESVTSTLRQLNYFRRIIQSCQAIVNSCKNTENMAARNRLRLFTDINSLGCFLCRNLLLLLTLLQ